MNATIDAVADSIDPATIFSAVVSEVMDPLDTDHSDDAVVVTTRRAICRVALVATETAGRFQRDALPYDPMSWMLAPRALFDGAAAIDACLERDACARGIMVHGLGLDLDLDRATIDALLFSGDDEEDFSEHEFRYNFASHLKSGGANRRKSRLRLYTATIVETRDNIMFQAFHASVALSREEIVGRLARRFGRDLAELADIRIGFHPSAPVVVAMVPEPVGEMIRKMQVGCTDDAARTFAIDLQHSIHA